MSEHHPLDYSSIDENVYIGTNSCCQHHFEEELLSKGIDTDISLEEERIDAPFGVSAFLWLPTKDHTPPTESQARLGAEMIAKAIDTGRKIYLHCKNGHGRAPTLYAAYLILHHGMTPADAVAHIKEKRPAIHLEGSQMTFLESLR